MALVINIILFIFGCAFLYITVSYIKAGNIIVGVIGFLSTIIIFSILRERIALYKMKEGSTSNIAKILSKKYEFTMQLPEGWQTHPYLESEFFEWKNKENNWGRIEIFPLELKDDAFDIFIEKEVRNYLDEVYGDEAKKTNYSQIISKELKQINGKEAVLLAIDMAESIEFHTYIRNNDEYLWILFNLLKEHFSQYESALRASITSICINPK